MTNEGRPARSRPPISLLAILALGIAGGAAFFVVEMSVQLPRLRDETFEQAPVGYVAVLAGYATAGFLAGLLFAVARTAARWIGGIAGRGGLWTAGALGLAAVTALVVRLAERTELSTEQILGHVGTVAGSVIAFVGMATALGWLGQRLGALRTALGYLVVMAALLAWHASLLDSFTWDRVFAGLPPSRAPESAPNVVLLTIDTQRADRFGCYGHDGDLTPHMDALAAEGAVFERAMSHAPWTRASFASLLTSRYPSQHGAFVVNDPATDGFHETWSDMLYNGELGDDAVTLAEILDDFGYTTLALQANWQASEAQNFDQGFDRFIYEPLFTIPILDRCLLGTYGSWLPALVGLARRLPFYNFPPEARQVYDVFASLVDAGLPEPFFLWVNFMDAHAPYNLRTEADDPDDAEITVSFDSWDPEVSADVLSAAYDEEVAYVDHYIGRMGSDLAERGLLDRTVLVITSDHGEDFEDHMVSVQLEPDHWMTGRHHGHSVYNELLHVPLIVRYPPAVAEGRRVGAVVRLVDIMPSLLELVGLDLARFEELEGESLVPLLTGEMDPAGPRWAYSERTYYGLEMKAIQDERSKLIYRYADQAVELYDLVADPEETENLAETRPADVERMRAELDRWIERMGPLLPEDGGAPGRDLDEQDLERLRALGYIR